MATAQVDTLLRHIEKLAGRGVGQWSDRQLLDEFATRGDETAFAELVARHGPMVLRVCRRVLHHEQDVEDAFQAVFLVLARNVRSIHKREALAGWLHGVAHRTAMKARRSAARRQNHEAQLRLRTNLCTSSPTWDEVQTVLNEEIGQLPEAFRSAFVLCVLEGKSGAEAAIELGCKEGTVKSRVNRARQVLRRRLAGRSIQLTALLAALSVAESAARASVSATLAQSTIRLGLLVAAGESAAGRIPSHVAALAAGVTRAMFLSKTKVITALLLVAGLLIAGAGALARQTPPAGSDKAEAKAEKPKSAGAKEDRKAEVTDEVPIAGQIVDLEGKPVAGATLRVKEIWVARSGDLEAWLKAIRDKKERSPDSELQYLKKTALAESPKVTTDAEGRFRLKGIARDRLVIVRLDGPTIVTQHLRILTRPGKAIEATEFEGKPEMGDPRRVTTYYGPQLRHVISPSRPIVGVVRDKDTKKPLKGFSIRCLKLANHPLHYLDGQEYIRTTTDEQGCYRLTGMPKGEGNRIKVVPASGVPYLTASFTVPNTPGLGPVTVDIALKRGIWVEGKVTDKVTGKPVKGGLQYFPLFSNPDRHDYPDDRLLFGHNASLKEDGSYRIAVMPGPGMITVFGGNHYLRVKDRQDEFGSKGLSEEEFPRYLRGSNCIAITKVNPTRGTERVKRGLTVDPGWELKGKILGTDGKPLSGTRSFLLVGHWWDTEATKTAEFTAWFNPHYTDEMIFQHPQKGLIGVAQPPKENGGSVTVRMERGAMATGRLVDAAGKPRAGIGLTVSFRPKGWGSWFEYSPAPIKTDSQGRFRIENLLPGGTFRLTDGNGPIPFNGPPRSGDSRDLGDVRVEPWKGRDR
jgi:RNA polymerase sigma factor (sigma-70 family)